MPGSDDSGFLDTLRAATAGSSPHLLGHLLYETVRSVYDAVKFGAPFAGPDERSELGLVSDAAGGFQVDMFEIWERTHVQGPTGPAAQDVPTRVGRAARATAEYLDTAGRGRLLLDSVDVIAAAITAAGRPSATEELALLAEVQQTARKFAHQQA